MHNLPTKVGKYFIFPGFLWNSPDLGMHIETLCLCIVRMVAALRNTKATLVLKFDSWNVNWQVTMTFDCLVVWVRAWHVVYVNYQLKLNHVSRSYGFMSVLVCRLFGNLPLTFFYLPLKCELKTERVHK